MKNIRLLTALLILAVLAIGCGGPGLKSVEPGKRVRYTADEVLIAGRVAVFEGSTELAPYGIDRPIVTLMNIDTGKSEWNSVENDGTFMWIVEPGTYAVKKLEYAGDVMRPRVALRARRGGEAYYVGTLRVTAEQQSRFGAILGGFFKDVLKRWVLVEVEVVDEGAITREVVGKKGNTTIAISMKDAFMVHDPEMPVNPKGWSPPEGFFR